MADAKLSALTELTVGGADGDELYIRDISEAAADESKRITLANLLNPENLTALAATPASTDELAINDGGVGKKITVSNLLAFYDSVTATLTNKTFTLPQINDTSADHCDSRPEICDENYDNPRRRLDKP